MFIYGIGLSSADKTNVIVFLSSITANHYFSSKVIFSPKVPHILAEEDSYYEYLTAACQNSNSCSQKYFSIASLGVK
jgi:hypothetical protein